MIEVQSVAKCFVQGLGRRQRRVQAVEAVSFAAADGRITGLLGPNGAGKTTTLRMVAALIEPDAGKITVDGVDVADVDALRGVLTRAGLDPSLVELASAPAIKEGLARNTAAFVDLGGCGVPTAHVAGRLVWGQDRWWQVEAALRANAAR